MSEPDEGKRRYEDKAEEDGVEEEGEGKDVVEETEEEEGIAPDVIRGGAGG